MNENKVKKVIKSEDGTVVENEDEVEESLIDKNKMMMMKLT